MNFLWHQWLINPIRIAPAYLHTYILTVFYPINDFLKIIKIFFLFFYEMRGNFKTQRFEVLKIYITTQQCVIWVTTAHCDAIILLCCIFTRLLFMQCKLNIVLSKWRCYSLYKIIYCWYTNFTSIVMQLSKKLINFLLGSIYIK